ncbi:MAG: glycosyltransferase family 2 protein [Candidatus Omnitrophota bacterium]
MKLATVIIPVFYNAESLPALYEQTNAAIKDIPDVRFELIFVDDGSGDNSFDVLSGIARNDSRVRIIKLTRNFGAFAACFAGLSYAKGDCAIFMAADLQDPPEILSKLIEKWKNGSEIVYAARQKREEAKLKIFFSNIFYFIFRKIALKDMPPTGFDFVLIGRKVIDVLLSAKEKNSSLIGQILWTGFKADSVPCIKKKRYFGRSRWVLSKKIKYLIDSLLSFSYFPIRAISLIGITMAMLSFIFGLYIISQKIFLGIPVPGFASILVIILFTSGIQMLMLGVLGEYLWRNLEETRGRPMFVVERLAGFDHAQK